MSESPAPDSPFNWPAHIGLMVLTKQELHAADASGFFPWHLPAVAATEEKLAATEARLGFALDPAHRAFLAHADGWRGFLTGADLFSSDELGDTAAQAALELMVSVWPDEMLEEAGLHRGALFPIAADLEIDCLFVMQHRDGSAQPHVTWFYNGVGEQYETFEEFFTAMIAYNRRNIEDARRYAIEDGLA